ncbi:unnamed protein product [Adineta steineri]|uniref:Protein kinase domain-containing protein n=2 Tax=Adineta steineri TaxID=433720 RepID=A0A814DSB5_9BILA|nr:unnamed protein product [Adineta steineri]CAF0968333.1 unnamed protein product [Adineta steineri]CAF1006249.1 unnamed protein product [Adineta steineri]
MSSGGIIRPNQRYRIQGEFYTLLSRLGYGSFGSVWTSRTENGDFAAVKVFDLSRSGNRIRLNERQNSFRNEIKMLDRMRNETEHIVTMYTFEYNPRISMAFIAMELADESLIDRVKNLHQRHLRSRMFDRFDFISANDRQNIWIQLVNIILTLHRYGIIHCDLKPANLLFFGPLLKVIDFGIAQDEFTGYNRRQRIGGTRPYSAPECFSDRTPVTSKADIWSVGAILYFLTYGKRPIYETAQAPDGVSQTRSRLVQDILQHCLQRNASRRPDHQWLAQHPLTIPPGIF